MSASEIQQIMEDISSSVNHGTGLDNTSFRKLKSQLYLLDKVLSESSDDSVRQSISDLVEELEILLTGDVEDVQEIYDSIVERISQLREIIFSEPDESATNGSSDACGGPNKVFRSEETIELLEEFLRESDEKLTQADQILMDIEQDEVAVEMVGSLIKIFHTIKGISGFLGLLDIESLAVAIEALLNQVRQGRRELQGLVLDLTFDTVEMMRLYARVIRECIRSRCEIRKIHESEELEVKIQALIDGREVPEQDLPAAEPGDKLGDVLQRGGYLSEDAVQAALQKQRKSGRKLGEELVAQGFVRPKQVSQALRAQQRCLMYRSSGVNEVIEVDAELIDKLMDIACVLVDLETMMTSTAEVFGYLSSDFNEQMNLFRKLSGDLQEICMQMRIVPIRELYRKVTPIVRDMLRESGKRVQLLKQGEDTGIDRGMVWRLADPLAHVVRNSLDHGIETTGERVDSGKPAVGKIILFAHRDDERLIIEVGDDGRGLDRERILAVAAGRGMAEDTDGMSDQDVYDLIFVPGFSTSDRATTVSGRGVGLYVVRAKIESMGGKVSVRSKPGRGTTVSLILPVR